MTASYRTLAVLGCLLIWGTPAAADRNARTAITGSPPVVVAEAYVSTDNKGDELDSLATWRHPDGGTWLIATAKSSHKLVVFDADTGIRLRDVGGPGNGPGEFKRPNGIAVVFDRLFVVERDNRRVQVFSLPAFKPLGSFGQDQLRSPYGLWLRPLKSGVIEAYVTDNFMAGERFDVVPPLRELDQRVRRFLVEFGADGETMTVAPQGSFGDRREATALRIVESIAGDESRQRLLIADEDARRGSTLREYLMTGRATGRSVPRNSFEGEAEGVALWHCAADRGYWLAVDQLAPLTRFRLFDRGSLAARGSFTGRTVALTDGITLMAVPTRRFPSGALFAVHRDLAVAAFDLRDIAAALQIKPGCL